MRDRREPQPHARKRFEEEPDHHERWLVSYADFMTLLFAFFVVMYAISSVNEGKYRILSNSLVTAFGKSRPMLNETEQQVPQRAPTLLLPRPRPNDVLLRREREQMTGIARDLLKALAPLVTQGKVRVTETSRGVSIEINDSILFAQGDAGLGPESSEVLKAIAAILKLDAHSIQVEGHTDNVPISKGKFPSNWELSAVRASGVVRLFIENGITENRLVAVGHGSNQPAASNDTAEGRMRNRRVQVMILSGLPEVVTELPLNGKR
ncbi:MAG: flagellar motor protein MotD [Herminiimonas sp.]|nr:flagellar motor protein MotD [Herminiimonas sp.]